MYVVFTPSRHSRRRLPINHSQNALARGARIGVRKTSISAATFAKWCPNFRSLSRIKYFGALSRCLARGCVQMSSMFDHVDICFKYFWIVRLLTERPNFNNSPRIRSAPHKRLSVFNCQINSIVAKGNVAGCCFWVSTYVPKIS